ncbi:MAG: 2-oxoacid:acceptor oxidoreductase family protein [Acidobacteria bacterium]|nr:2-oxoacid:acceptor oxidoreductase family protein [Acidobacteriota bacterium]
MSHQLLITGIGGQGVLFLTKLLYTTALLRQEPVFAYEVHGMSQRGGSVFSSLKIGNFASPQLFPGDVDTLIALESSEVFPYLNFLKPSATVLVNSSTLTAAQRSWLESAPFAPFLYDADRVALQLRNPRVSNLVLLGRYMAERDFVFTRDDILSALEQLVKPTLLEINRSAFLAEE